MPNVPQLTQQNPQPVMVEAGFGPLGLGRLVPESVLSLAVFHGSLPHCQLLRRVAGGALFNMVPQGLAHFSPIIIC